MGAGHSTSTLAIGFASLLAISLGLAHGCGNSSSGAVGADGGPYGVVGDAAVVVDAGEDPPSDAGALLGNAPDGWARWNDYDPSCSFYVPLTKDALPSPIAWEPCGAGLVPTGVSCQQMAIDWGPNGTLSASVSSYVQPSGGVLFQISRSFGPAGAEKYYRLVAEADGPVHQAILDLGNQCGMGTGSVYADKVVYWVADSESGKLGASGGGAAGGKIDERPSVLLHFHDKTPRDYAAGATTFMEDSLGAVWRHDFLSPDTKLAIPFSPDDVGLISANYFYVGNDIFWDSNASTYFRVNAWTPDGGTKSVLSFGNDATRGAYDFGTDGKDMVWHEGTGLTTVSKPAGHVDIMTAPYATEASKVVKRRLRSENVAGGYGGYFKVGCGYAASSISSDTVPDTVGIRIIRLSDGVSWTLLTPISNRQAGGVLNDVLAVTCGEVFLRFSSAKFYNQIARVRIDSLVSPVQPSDPPL
jgi:hypothetical protein